MLYYLFAVARGGKRFSYQDCKSISYEFFFLRDAKNRAHVYAVVKKMTTNALADGGCGRWVTKPQEGSNFFLNDGFNLSSEGALNRDGSAC